MHSSFTARTKPPALQPGDAVGIVAPASNIKRELLDKGCEVLRQQGYRPFYFDSILQHDLYFAGSAERRARELEEMFARDDVKAIICARGGYGANYLLPMLDLGKIKAHPKIFVGYSDTTTLLTYFASAVGAVSVGTGRGVRGDGSRLGRCRGNTLRRLPFHACRLVGNAV